MNQKKFPKFLCRTATITLYAVVGGLSGFAQTPDNKPLPPTVTCVLSRYTERGIDSWHAKCEIRDGAKVLHNSELPLAMPCTLRDAMRAAEQFIQVTSLDILERQGYKIQRKNRRRRHA